MVVFAALQQQMGSHASSFVKEGEQQRVLSQGMAEGTSLSSALGVSASDPGEK